MNSDNFLRVTGWFAVAVGGAAAGVNGFFTSEILVDINLDWCKKAPRDICNAFRSSTFFNYCPGGGFSIGNITNHLKQARVNEKTQHLR